MLTSQIKNEIKHNFIDYKQPVNVVENDFRTSTYLGHRYFKRNDFTIPPANTLISPSYTLHQKEMRYDYASEQSSQYTPKYNFDRTNKANLYMCCSKPTFAKSMERRIFTNPPKPLRNGSSHSRDYVHRPRTHKDYVVLNSISSIGKLSGYSGGGGSGDDGGCYKYDSTNMSVYKPPIGERIPPGCSKDTITVWNFIQSHKFRPSDFPKQKIVGNRSTFLKHNGMKSENQSSFIVPVPKKFVCDVMC